MGIEIERKFLVDMEKLKKNEHFQKVQGKYFQEMTQGYLSTNPTVRIRRSRVTQDSVLQKTTFELTIKGKGLLTRAEINKDLDEEEYQQLLSMASQWVTKTRITMGRWEIDIFHNKPGLFLAEIELDSETEPVDLPEWIIREVTDDPAYQNQNLTSLKPV